jgi:hypothetical protein
MRRFQQSDERRDNNDVSNNKKTTLSHSAIEQVQGLLGSNLSESEFGQGWGSALGYTETCSTITGT